MSKKKKKKNFPNKKVLPTKKKILVQNFTGRRKKIKLIVNISINQNQNQIKETVETQTECETDNESDIEFVRITALHRRECLKRKVAKIDYS